MYIGKYCCPFNASQSSLQQFEDNYQGWGNLKYILVLFYVSANWYKDLVCINDFWCWIK